MAMQIALDANMYTYGPDGGGDCMDSATHTHIYIYIYDMYISHTYFYMIIDYAFIHICSRFWPRLC